jgi:hypothetical protein
MNNEQLDLIQDTLDRLMNDIKALHIQLEALKYIKDINTLDDQNRRTARR